MFIIRFGAVLAFPRRPGVRPPRFQQILAFYPDPPGCSGYADMPYHGRITVSNAAGVVVAAAGVMRPVSSALVGVRRGRVSGGRVARSEDTPSVEGDGLWLGTFGKTLLLG